MWLWRLDPTRGYSARGAYQLLTSHPSDSLDVVADLIWRKQILLNVSIFAWRLLRDRSPTKSNLTTRGIITPEAQSCVTGCGDMAPIYFLHHLWLSFDRQLGRGWACYRWILQIWLIIIFSLRFHAVVSEHVASSYNLFDSYVSGLFGTKEINFI
jgi:hypothetical protein